MASSLKGPAFAKGDVVERNATGDSCLSRDSREEKIRETSVVCFHSSLNLLRKKGEKKGSKEAAILAHRVAAQLQNVDVLRVSGSQLA